MTTTQTTPAYDLSGWSLADLLPNADEKTIAAHLAQLGESVEAFEALRPRLHEDATPADVLTAVEQFESITEQIYVLDGYASLWFSSDTQSAAALSFQNRITQALTGYENRVLFFDIWWKSLDDDEAAALMPDAGEHPDYAFFLESVRRYKPFTLDEGTEQVINTKDANGMESLLTLYSMLTNRLEFTLTVDGETKTLNRSQMTQYYYSPDPAMRAAVFQEIYRVFAKESPILGQIYVSRVRDWHAEQVELRKQTSPISVRNLTNNIPDAAVQTLLDVARRNAPLFQRYFKLKAGWLGLEKLRRYDIYAPLATSDKKVPFSAAAQMVLETFSKFDPQVAAHAQRVFDDNHMDSEIRTGKRDGAFCATLLPEVTPWVLMNYTGKMRDVATLAHELGHAIHSMASEHHSILTQHPPLPLAETASVFSEILLTERLLAEESDPLARRELLAAAVDDMYATVMRQAYFVIFEQSAHEAIRQDASTEQLNALYLEQLREQFGDSVEVSDEFQHEWVSIPHIYSTPFYCYAYSFGQLLVLALYRRYQQEGDAFKPGYLKLLAYGGSAAPDDILKEMGIDMADPAFWQGGFDVIGDMIDEVAAIQL